jgi:hypothetical protein
MLKVQPPENLDGKIQLKFFHFLPFFFRLPLLISERFVVLLTSFLKKNSFKCCFPYFFHFFLPDAYEQKKQQRMNERMNAINAKYQRTLENEENDKNNKVSDGYRLHSFLNYGLEV